MQRHPLRASAALFVALMFLAACGGGDGGGGGTPPAATPTTGTFVDSPVNGLHYTSSPSNPAGGLTTNGGQYHCMPGDTVTFDLGGRTIGTGQPCGPLVTVVSVFGATSTADTRVKNLSQLLLTLGGIPTGQNPIQLPATIPADLPNPLDFSDPNFTTVLQTALPGTAVVTQGQATTHLQTSFKTLSVAAVNGETVTSNPAGITCTAGDCSYDFVTGTAVTLTATGTGFTGWSGDGCSGTGTCQIMLEAITAVRALFSPCASVINIAPASLINGALTTGDCTMEELFPSFGDQSFVDQYRITLPSKGTLSIRMDSNQFDTYLVLLHSPLQLPEIAFDDDSGGGTNALISVDLNAGTYIILANSAFETADTGAYTLTTTFNPWSPTSPTGAPEARADHTAVWTGSEMVVWGGDNGNAIAKNTGGRFDPLDNTWTPTTTVGAPSARRNHTAVWTGSEMVVWGGLSGAGTLNDGAKYNPQTDTWTPITTVGAPPVRFNHTAIWTGTEMIVWGGFSFSDSGISDGARYNPATDTWTPISATDAPSARGDHSAVWTGSKIIVWGGRNGSALIDSGGIYDTVSNSWVPTNLSSAPAARSEHAAAWTGSEMIIFGGRVSTGSTNSFNTGGLYNPTTDSWTPTNTVGAPVFTLSPRMRPVWTGTEMIVWDGGGGRYNPVSNSWFGISTLNAPSSRMRHSLVWTGSNMIVWGGEFAVVLNTGGIYDPSNDSTP